MTLPGRSSRSRSQERGDGAEPEADPVGVARRICLQQLEVKPRTRAELATTLAKRGVPDEAVQEVLGRFAEVGLVDDALFASLWVTSRHRGKGLAGRALSQELRRKGVQDELVEQAVEQLDPELQLETARSLVRRRLASTRGLPTDARVRRLVGVLARKGYPSGTAFRVVREALAEEGEQDDDLLDVLETQD